MTMVDKSILTNRIELSNDPEFGLCVELCCWDHLDYIEDVLAEHFDVEYDFKVDDPDSSRYALFFGEQADETALRKSISEINRYHACTEQIFVTV